MLSWGGLSWFGLKRARALGCCQRRGGATQRMIKPGISGLAGGWWNAMEPPETSLYILYLLTHLLDQHFQLY
jgi:hypothetical protein